jgi:hypothetical protein
MTQHIRFSLLCILLCSPLTVACGESSSDGDSGTSSSEASDTAKTTTGTGESTTSDTDTSSDGTQTTDTTSTSTSGTGSGAECETSVGCYGETPICVDGECVACDSAAAANTSCAEEKPNTLVCDDGKCVVCSDQDTSACSGRNPLCVNNGCVGCTAHSQCPESACVLDVGSCFDPTVFHVNGDAVCASGDGSEATPFCTIQEGVDAIGVGFEGVVVIHESATPYGETVTVTNLNTRIAFIGAPGEAPVWGHGGAHSLRADGARLYVHNIRFFSAATSAIEATFGGAVTLTSSIIGGSGSSAITTNDAGFVRAYNCFIGAGGSVPVIDVNSGGISLDWVTVGSAGLGPEAIGIRCIDGANSVVADSIVVTAGAAPEIACMDIELSEVFTELDAGEPFDDMSTWFVDFLNSDFHINPNAPATFTDPLSTFSTWFIGDQTTDIDGDPRDTVEGQPQYSGADVPNN